MKKEAKIRKETCFCRAPVPQRSKVIRKETCFSRAPMKRSN